METSVNTKHEKSNTRMGGVKGSIQINEPFIMQKEEK